MTILFSKPTHNTSVAHLYEHIFVDLLTQYLRSKGLFSYVDYDLSAKTYHEGSVVLEIDVYNDAATELIDSYIKTPIAINSDLINGGLLQIMAESSSDILYMNDEAVMASLNEYNTSPWEKGRVALPANWEMQEPAIQYVKLDDEAFGVVEQTITINAAKLPKNLWPLCLVVGKALRNNLIEDITAGTFCFSYEDSFIVDGNKLVDTNFYRVDKRQASAITVEYEIASKLVGMARENGFAQRLGNSLRNAPKDSFAYPVEDEILAKLGMNTTEETWRLTATDENILRIVELVNVEFRFRA